MNKHLLLGSALLAALSVFPQDAHRAKPTGIAEPKLKVYPAEKESQNLVAGPTTNPTPLKNGSGNSNAKTTAITASRFSGSANVFGMLVTEANSLTFNEDLGAVAFVHRASAAYTAAPTNGNSGTIVAKYTINNGTSWDSTVMWTHNTNLARYPQGGIYNPLGNTNINSAYVVGMGPITTGGWTGNWYASKQLSIPGTLTPGTDQQSIMNATATSSLNVHHFSRMSFAATDDGKVRSIAQIENDPNAGTYAGIAYRGAGIVTGVFNAGAFVWTMDSIIPPFLFNTNGGYNYADISAIQAWNDAGDIGYVVFNGVRQGELTSDPCNCRANGKGGWQPIVYKTTNYGASWVLLPAEDFTDSKYRGLTDRLYSVTAPSGTIIPYFTTGESRDAAVDVNGNLHLVTTVVQHYSDHIDSLGYSYQFTYPAGGTEKYNWGHSGSFDHPIIYDFYTTSGGSWWYHMVDSMGTEGPSGGTTSTNPGWNYNPWVDATSPGNKMYLDARIQISRTTDGKRLYYSWTETDTNFTANKWNSFPDINMKGYDVTTDMATTRLGNINASTASYTSITTGLPDADTKAYWHYMSDKAIGSGSGSTNTVPFTITHNPTTDGGLPVNHYYINGVDVPANAFTVTPMRPTGINSEVNNSSSSFEVFNYPNPASESTTIFVNLKDAKVLDVTVYNTIGQLVKSAKVNGEKGSNEIKLDVSGLSKGVYIYNVKTNSTVVSKKLIVE